MSSRFESSVIVRLKVGVSVRAAALGMKTQPESKPPETGLQGSVKVDCVMLWLPGLEDNVDVELTSRIEERS